MPNVPDGKKEKVLDPAITKDELKVINVFDTQMDKLLKGKTTIDRVLDTFTNFTARIGGGTESQSEGASYFLTRLSFDYQTITALFRNSWIVKKIIVLVATDMNKLGIQISTELDPKDVDKIEKKLDEVNQKMIEGTKWGRLYGGAVGILMIKDVMNKMVETKDGTKVRLIELPLEIDDINVDSFGGIYILDRWNGVSADTTLETDMMSYNYGRPKYYMINLPNESAVKIHHSWVLPFLGIDLPRIERLADNGWGMSDLEPVFRELQKRDNTNYSVANLVFQASLRVFKFDNFRQSVATGSKAFQKEMQSRLESLVKYQSNQRATIIDTKDSFEVHSATFAGLDSILEIFAEDIAGASNIPMTKLFGRQGKNFGGDDKAAARNYSDFINAEQEERLRHNYEKLLMIISKSELGKVPDDMTFEFIAHYDSDIDTKRSQLEQELTQIAIPFENGGIPRSLYLKELKERGKEFNMFTNITDDMIIKAEKDERLDPGEVDDDYDDIDETVKSKDGLKLFKKWLKQK